MKILRMATALVLLVSASRLPAQTAPPPAKASVQALVDVHPSPYRTGIYSTSNISDQRYDLRNATLLQLIAIAYDLQRDDSTILGGPNWIELDRFDLAAKIDTLKAATPNPDAKRNDPGMGNPQADPYQKIRPVLQDVLTQRFHLAYHTEDKAAARFHAHVGQRRTQGDRDQGTLGLTELQRRAG